MGLKIDMSRFKINMSQKYKNKIFEILKNKYIMIKLTKILI